MGRTKSAFKWGYMAEKSRVPLNILSRVLRTVNMLELLLRISFSSFPSVDVSETTAH